MDTVIRAISISLIYVVLPFSFILVPVFSKSYPFIPHRSVFKGIVISTITMWSLMFAHRIYRGSLWHEPNRWSDVWWRWRQSDHHRVWLAARMDIPTSPHSNQATGRLDLKDTWESWAGNNCCNCYRVSPKNKFTAGSGLLWYFIDSFQCWWIWAEISGNNPLFRSPMRSPKAGNHPSSPEPTAKKKSDRPKEISGFDKMAAVANLTKWASITPSSHHYSLSV